MCIKKVLNIPIKYHSRKVRNEMMLKLERVDEKMNSILEAHKSRNKMTDKQVDNLLDQGVALHSEINILIDETK